MILIDNKYNCCGCTACASICSHMAIKMNPDSLGFLYPQVNSELCVGCGLCDKVCQFYEGYKRYNNYETPMAYQFRLSHDEQLKRSQSGGAFFAIADKFIANGGVVYGAAFTKNWRVTHQKANSSHTLSALRMSKYVQSDLRGSFTQVKEDLRKGTKVLFSGTACQVAGLKSYLPNCLHDNLFCIDIICHGVPSPQIWEDYLAYLQKLRNSKIVKACFRDKRFGWHGARESFLFENGKEEFRRTSNYLYFSGFSMRESCSVCYYTNFKRVGDITVGDQWGIPKDSTYEDGKGLSLILINSEKGKYLFECAKLKAESITLQDCIQPQLEQPSTLHSAHLRFVRDYETKGFLYVAKKVWKFGMEVQNGICYQSINGLTKKNSTKMKIALLTIWHEKNYGAELQAYATIKAIKHLGHCPEMINIHLASKEQPSFLGRIANFIEKLLPASTKFERFWSYYIPKTKKYNSVSELYNDPPQADIYIVGSDQVWNPDITKEYWKMFFLDFGTTKVKRLSFSSSFGIKDWNHPEHVDFVKSALNQFSFVTCREDSGMKLLRDVFGVEATSVLDPTLLFDSYDEFVPNSQIRKTLVYYPLSEDWELTDYCENLAKKLGLTAINTNRKTTIFNKLIWNRVSIEQWVRNIAYSEFVITRSFHGLAFCLIYQRQFAILKSRNDRGTRLDNLLSKLDLQDRIYQNTMELDNAKPWENPIDYSILMPKLNALRKESWLILERIIEKE